MSHRVIEEWFLLGRYRVLKLDRAVSGTCTQYRINGKFYEPKNLNSADADLCNFIAIRTPESFLGAAVEFV